jgi:phosphatidylinositol alpha-1,6-mannosyltransferase
MNSPSKNINRTLLITNDFPPVVSGISTVFYQVWVRLSPEGHWILTPKVREGRHFDEGKNLKVIRHFAFPATNPVFKTINWAIQLGCAFYLVLFQRVSKIHAGQIWTSGTISYLLKLFLNCPYLLWVYGGETSEVYMKNRLTTWWAQKILGKAKKIVVNSRFCQREFLDYGFKAEDCPIVLPGVDTNFFTPGSPSIPLIKKWGTEGKKVLLTVARLTERKGHDLVIRTLPEILQEFPQILYLIVGRGGDRERLEKLAGDLGVTQAVRFCGFVPDEELPEYYRLCDVYVMPNRETYDSTDSIEGFGISFIEASACGKAVIGGKSGGAVEAVAEGVSGFLVDPDSVEELVHAIRKLLSNDELRREIELKGRERAVKEMDWCSRANLVLELERG